MGRFMKKKYSAVLIGTGRIGFSLGFDKKREQPASHTMAVLNEKRIFFAAAADTCEKNAEKWEKYVNFHQGIFCKKVKVYSSSEELYKNIHPDIIIVAVNEESHLKECLNAIAQNPKLVILEKPVALNSVEGETLLNFSREKKVPVMVNHERRFDKSYSRVLSWIKKIGKIQWIHGELDSGLRVWGEEFEKDGTYSLIHDGTHLVDTIRFLSGSILETPSVTGIVRDEKNIVRNFTAIFSTEEIPEIQIRMSGRSKFFEFRIEILGTEGKICIGNGIQELYIRQKSSLYSNFYSLKKVPVKKIKKTCYFSGMIKNAADYLDGTAALLSPLEQSLTDLKILETIKENFASGK